MAVQPPQGPERKQKETLPVQEESLVAIVLKSKGPRLKEALIQFQFIRPNLLINIKKPHFI